MEFITKSTKETQDLGKKFAATLKGGEVILLQGDLGSGKTTFVQGVAQGLGVSRVITSPTFILMRTYSIPHATDLSLYHLDLYRLEHGADREIEALGVFDLWGKPDAIVCIEWPERIKKIPSHAIRITFSLEENDHHTISIPGTL